MFLILRILRIDYVINMKNIKNRLYLKKEIYIASKNLSQFFSKFFLK